MATLSTIQASRQTQASILPSNLTKLQSNTLQKIVGTVEQKMDDIQEIAKYVERSMPELVDNAFKAGGIFSDAEVKKLRSQSEQLIASESQAKQALLAELAAQEGDERREIDSELQRLDRELQTYDHLYNSTLVQFVERDAPVEQLQMRLSLFDGYRDKIRDQKEQFREKRASLAQKYTARRNEIQSTKADIDAVYEPYNREKKIVEEALQIADSIANKKAEDQKRAVETCLAVVTSEVDNMCKASESIGKEISNKHERDMSLAINVSNFLLDSRKQSHIENMDQARFGLEQQRELAKQKRQAREDRFEQEQQRNALALEYLKVNHANQHQKRMLEIEAAKSETPKPDAEN